ncbi:probable arabinosyltransferase ARAD1 [Impatiens glandulifera]|uniref:probable arabinosyltransferase ARAD1 n=1 Tax=Impatiens glandulifera TaxID=253017 RepID=UPI001FB19C7D|nr:probable arabinosyltransferase ARAD1 [Impatiens glandulifera]
MVGKSVLTLTFIIILLITYAIFTGTIDPKSYFFPQLQSQSIEYSTPNCSTDSPLRVYMYDLPRRFNVGMIDRRSYMNETPVTAQNFPPWPRTSGLMKQHSVEYWLMASLILYEQNKNNGNNNLLEAIRVFDPETAEVFFVPFFSSMSFNIHGRNMTDPDTEFDRQLQVDVIKYLRESRQYERSKGRDHVIVMHHPNSFRFLRDQLNASILIVADFGRNPKIVSNLSKDVVAPYAHVVDSFVDDISPTPYESRTTLLFFRGRTVRKADGVVRAKLKKILAGYKDVRYEHGLATDESIKLSSKGMRSSKFCLSPAGDTPSSNRLFDAIVSHCVPVVVSDKIELPFEDELDYNKFCVFFSINEALTPGYMVKQLRNFHKEKWLEMWRQLNNVSHYFEYDQYPPRKELGATYMIWRQVKNKVPIINLALHRNGRLKVPDWWLN